MNLTGTARVSTSLLSCFLDKQQRESTQPKLPRKMESIFEELPAEMGETSDWNVTLVDGTLLPGHSQCLGAVSPVLAFALKTADKEASVPFPQGSAELLLTSFSDGCIA